MANYICLDCNNFFVEENYYHCYKCKKCYPGLITGDIQCKNCKVCVKYNIDETDQKLLIRF